MILWRIWIRFLVSKKIIFLVSSDIKITHMNMEKALALNTLNILLDIKSFKKNNWVRIVVKFPYQDCKL